MRNCEPSDEEGAKEHEEDIFDNEDEMGTESEHEIDEEEDRDRASWFFLLLQLNLKERDIFYGAMNLKKSLMSGGVTQNGATRRARQNYFKLLAKELREQLMDLVLNMRILRKDSIFKSIMDETHLSNLPFAEAFRHAWKKHKNTIIEEVLKPTFPPKPEEKAAAEEQEEEETQMTQDQWVGTYQKP